MSDRSDARLSPCPFCGCSMEARYKHFPNGTGQWEPHGWHDETCPLEAVIWCMEEDEGWTRERVIEAWERRWQDA